MVVGKRSTKVGIMYSAVGVVFLIMLGFVMGNSFLRYEDGMLMLFIIMIFLAVEAWVLYHYFKTPKDAIILNYNKSISLPGLDVTIPMIEVTDISYIRATARGISYKWGKVVIKTNERKYVVNYLEECEEVCKNLTREMYAYRAQ